MHALKLDASLEPTIDRELENVKALPAIREHVRQMAAEMSRPLWGTRAYYAIQLRCAWVYGSSYSACMEGHFRQMRNNLLSLWGYPHLAN